MDVCAEMFHYGLWRTGTRQNVPLWRTATKQDYEATIPEDEHTV